MTNKPSLKGAWSGHAKPKIVKFCTHVGYINTSNKMTYHPQKQRGYGYVTVLKFCRLPWRSASRALVSDSWATCWRWQSSVILDFQKFDIYPTLWSANMHHRAKFRANRSSRCGYYGCFAINFSRLHLLYGCPEPHTSRPAWWSLCLCKIWIESTL